MTTGVPTTTSASKGSAQLPFMIRRPSLILWILTFALLVAIGLFQWERYRTFRTDQNSLLVKSSEGAAAEIAAVLVDMHQLIFTLVSGQQALLQQIIDNPEDRDLYDRLDNNFLNYFTPDYRGFTVTRSDGRLVVRDYTGLVGTRENFLERYAAQQGITLDSQQAETAWQEYLLRFQQSGRYGHFALHPNSAYHPTLEYFGITANSLDYVVFLAFSPDVISRILRNYQLSGQNMLLIRRTESNQAQPWIEVDPAESQLHHLHERQYLSTEIQGRVAASVAVPGTLWDLVAYPDAGLFAGELKRLIWEYVLISLAIGMFVVLAMWFINRETIQRQIAMRSLRQSEERFSQLAEHLHQVFWMYGTEGMLYVSPAYKQVWGRSRGALYEGRETWLEAVHPADRERISRFHGDAAVTGEFDEEYRIIRPDGSIRWIWDRGFPIRNDTGEIHRTAGIAEDITERKRAEEALRQTEASYKTVVEDQTELICRFLTDYTLSFVNEAYCRYFDSTSTHLIGTSFLQFALPEDWPEVEKQLKTLSRDKPTTTYEHRVKLANGSTAWLQWNNRALFDSQDAPIGYQSVGRDITERKRMEEALQRAHDELEERVQSRTRELEVEIAERKLAEEKIRGYAAQVERSNRELKDFAYVCSHDLQEPLRKIQAFGDRLKTKFHDDLPERGQDYLERMQNAAARMQKLINDLLVLSRIENRALSYSAVDLGEIIRQVGADLEIKLEETHGKLLVEELPTLEADPMQMRQLFQNLIGNALKFHQPNRGPTVQVRAQPIEHTNCYQIFVEDDGIGFDEKFLDKIFTAFQRLHTREAYEGTGIGLSICYRIAARHGGSITARSTPGEGSTFIVTLPIKQTADEAA